MRWLRICDEMKLKLNTVNIEKENGGCPSDSMMMSAFCNSSMNTEVAPQPQPRGTESLTVGALEVSCCDHCRSCSAVSLFESSEFLASSLFEVGGSSVNRASPFWSFHGIFIQVSRIDVFILQFWYILVSFAGLEFPVHLASRDPTFLHSNHVSNPSMLGLGDGGLYAGGRSLIENLQIGDVVLPPDSRMERTARMWKSSNFLICLRYNVHISQLRGGREEQRRVVELQFCR